MSARPKRSCTLKSVVNNAIEKRDALKETINKTVNFARKYRKQRRQAKKAIDTCEPRQSPVDIRSKHLVHDPHGCKVDTLNVNYTLGDCCDLICTDTGFRVNVRKECSTTVTAEHLDGNFELAQFHAHWGQECGCGSEHTLDGKSFDGEVHFVFWNTKYGSFTRALDHGDGLAVLGVFLQESCHSDNYQSLIDVVKKSIGSPKAVEMPRDFVIDQLFPENRDFVTYNGSLTTPPFSEAVIWTLFAEPVQVSRQQLNVLRKITPNNYRACQNLHSRVVRSSKTH